MNEIQSQELRNTIETTGEVIVAAILFSTWCLAAGGWAFSAFCCLLLFCIGAGLDQRKRSSSIEKLKEDQKAASSDIVPATDS